MTQEPAVIDADAIFKQKNPRVYKLLPGFILRYVKRTIHQDEINEALLRFKDYYGLEFLRHILDYMEITYTVDGIENIPGKGRFIFVANHPLGGLDGMIFMEVVGKHFQQPKTISNDLLMNLKNLEILFIPVNKHGRQTTEYVRGIQELYRSDIPVISFPAGLCSRKTRKGIMDLDWKKSFISKAIEYKRDVIPVHFEGRNSKFFYRLANLRKLLGISANIEMFYLPDEMFRQRGRKIHMTIGKPVSHTVFNRSKSHAEWAEEIKKAVYELGSNRLKSGSS